MHWTKLPFSKYEGKTLPEIIAIDLDWFLHMQPRLRWGLGIEAETLLRRLRSIKVRPGRVIEFYHDNSEFIGFAVVKKKKPMTGPGAVRFAHLDLSAPRLGREYGKRECRKIIRCLRYWYFGEGKRLTKRRIEKFFSDENNFLNP